MERCGIIPPLHSKGPAGLIPFFTGYLVIVWWLACKFRRTWLGFACVGGGALFMGLVIYAHYQLGEWTQGRIYAEVLQPILYGYGALVTGMGLFIASLPRRVEHGPACHVCGYDLAWMSQHQASPTQPWDPAASNPLAEEFGRCPECGTSRPRREHFYRTRFASAPSIQAHHPQDHAQHLTPQSGPSAATAPAADTRPTSTLTS